MEKNQHEQRLGDGNRSGSFAWSGTGKKDKSEKWGHMGAISNKGKLLKAQMPLARSLISTLFCRGTRMRF